ncbi:MAG: LamG-like jellyroll fold domain-containing protein [Bacteroidales bacterium]
MRKISTLIVMMLAVNLLTAQVNLMNGLVAWYPLDGNANDLSGNGNNGIVNGATLTTDRFGNANSAYNFAGVANPQSILVPSSNSLNFTNQASISLWINMNSYYGMDNTGANVPLGTHILWAKENGSGFFGSVTGQSDGKFIAHTSPNGTGNPIEAEEIVPCSSIGQWVHLAFVFYPYESRIYANGVLIKRNYGVNNFTNSQNKNLWFGRSIAVLSYPLNGKLDDIRIYNRPLNEEEIHVLYSGVNPPTVTTAYLCGPGSATLTASGAMTGQVYHWYENELSCAPIATGSSFTTPALTQSHTYYVTIEQNGIESYRVPAPVIITQLPANIGQPWTLPESLNEGLTAWYPLDGNTNDISTNQNHGTGYNLLNGPNPAGEPNKAMYFNGNNAWIEVPNSPSLMSPINGLTITGWIKSENNNAYVLNKINGPSINSYQYKTEINTGNETYGLGFNGQTYNSGSAIPIPDNEWFHYAATFNGNQIKFYINGQLSSSVNQTGTIIPNSQRLEIGRDGYNTLKWLKGWLDEIRIYNRALNEDEILNLSGQYKILDVSLASSTVCNGNNANFQIINSQPGIRYRLFANGNATNQMVYGNGQTLTLASAALSESTSFTIEALNETTGCSIILSNTWNVTVVTPQPQITPNYTEICYGSSTTLTASGGVSYLWNTGQTTASISVAPTVNTTYSVIVTTQEGCTGTATAQVVVNPLPTPAAWTNSPVCENHDLNLYSMGGVAYSWTGPNGFTSNLQNPVISPVSTNNAGWYSVNVTDTNGCSAQASTFVNVFPSSYNTINPYICHGQTYTLPGGMVVSQTGTYIDTIPAHNGCDSIITVNLTVRPLPEITTYSNSPICAGETLTVGASAPQCSFLWLGPNGFISTQAQFSIPNVQLSHAGIYQVAATDPWGCMSSASVVVEVIKIQPTYQEIDLCQGQGYTLPGGTTVYTSGTYYDTLVSYQGCDSVIVSQVTFHAQPTPAIYNLSTDFCEHHTLHLHGEGGTYYLWTLPTGDTMSGQDLIIENANVGYFGWFHLTVTNQYNCSASTMQFVMILPVTFTHVKEGLCPGDVYMLPSGKYISEPGLYIDTLQSQWGCDSIIFSEIYQKETPALTLTTNAPVCAGAMAYISASGADEFVWSGPGGFVAYGSNITFAEVTPEDAGWYYVIGIDTMNCFAIDSIYLMVSCEGRIEQNSLVSNVSPNPFTNQLKIKLVPELTGEMLVRLFDLAGREVYREIINQTPEITLNLGWLKRGAYMLEVSHAGLMSRIKVIKM